ncbi:MAG: hypothetical protein B7Z64_10570 [Acidiphilium sp. 21-68-69]|nr:MAG: hypothetical protein B7Z64_10570 [Acidiphilium sp. 21-68-69]
MRSEELIASLAQDLRGVRPLPSPARLLATWLGVTVPVLAAITLIMGPRPDLAGKCGEAGFLISEGLGVVTALVSAYAAFCAGRPDQPGWKLWLPMLAMLAWLGEFGRQCAVLGVQDAGGMLRLTLDPMCVPGIAIAGVIPAGFIVMLLRRSATAPPAGSRLKQRRPPPACIGMCIGMRRAAHVQNCRRTPKRIRNVN